MNIKKVLMYLAIFVLGTSIMNYLNFLLYGFLFYSWHKWITYFITMFIVSMAYDFLARWIDSTDKE